MWQINSSTCISLCSYSTSVFDCKANQCQSTCMFPLEMTATWNDNDSSVCCSAQDKLSEHELCIGRARINVCVCGVLVCYWYRDRSENSSHSMNVFTFYKEQKPLEAALCMAGWSRQRLLDKGGSHGLSGEQPDSPCMWSTNYRKIHSRFIIDDIHILIKKINFYWNFEDVLYKRSLQDSNPINHWSEDVSNWHATASQTK